jgi:hypothetical protein
VAVPPVEAALAVGVGDGRVVSVGWAVGVADAVPLTVGVGVGVPPPTGAVVLAAGEGVGVQATAGSLVDIFGLCAGPVMILTPSGSVHRLEFAGVPPLRPLAPGLAVP